MPLAPKPPRLDSIAAEYRSALAEARRRPTWRLRYRARRWRKHLAEGCLDLDDLTVARLGALRREVLGRAVADLPPTPLP